MKSKSILTITLYCVILTTVRVSAQAIFVPDVTYAEVDTIKLQLNIAIPAIDQANQDRKFPLLLFIHGGGWRGGHRNAYNKRIKEASNKGYVGVTISHRLTSIEERNGKTVYPWPAAIYDGKAAVRYLKANAEKYHIDTLRIGVAGASSGGHLALMLGLTNATHGLEGNVEIVKGSSKVPDVSSRIHAVVNISGPTDMILLHKTPVVKPFVEYLFQGSPIDNPVGYIEASPITYLVKDGVAIMTLHGKLDKVVPFEQAVILDNKIKALGGDHILNSFDDQGHEFKGDAVKKAWRLLYTFFDQHLKK